MTFDSERAHDFVAIRDRDLAPFFAGRDDEIAQFDLALKEAEVLSARNLNAAVFRIYQGAPGCGKTSLLGHLQQVHHQGLLFVNVRARHLASETALLEQIHERAIAVKSTPDKFVTAGEAVLEFLHMKELRRTLRKEVSEYLTSQSRIVLYSDEAQTFGSEQQSGLLMLHQNELGVPVIVVFAGLSHTSERIRAIDGLSRLARNVVINMGEMSGEDCVQSTRKMFQAFGIDDESSTIAACERIAHMSRGWPQHLNQAQIALARELLETKGDLSLVDMDKVEKSSDQARAEYYEDRLEGSVLGERPEIVSALVRRLERQQPRDPLAFKEMCADEIDARQLNGKEGFDPEGYAQAMLEQGVLSKDQKGRYLVSIPSMSEWLMERYSSNKSNRISIQTR